MTTTTLEQEAVVFKLQRGQMVWRLYASGMCTDEMIGDRWTPEVACVPPQEFLASFIAAATARDKGARSLRDARVVVRQLVEWAEEEGCDCGQNDPPCALCVGKAFLGGDQ